MKNLYVGNLPHSTTEDQLRELFQVHGAVDRASIVTDRDTRRSRGFGFVEMTNAGEAEKAIAALNGTELGGRQLTVNEAKPKTDRPRSGAKFGGRGKSAEAGTMIIAVTRVSHGNLAGSFCLDSRLRI